MAANNYYPGGSLMPDAYYNAENYRHSYQGSEKDDEITGTTGTHITTHYRENDTRLLRWWSHDPKANASESQYMSMGGNPIWHNDVLGDTIRGSKSDMSSYNNFRQDINNRIATLNGQINAINSLNRSSSNKLINRIINGSISELQITLNELYQTNSELDKLEKSSQEYILNLRSTNGFVGWQPDASLNGISYEDVIKVNINTSFNTNQSFAHELKHAFQYDNLQLTFNQFPTSYFGYCDLADEIEAYQRSFYFGTINNIDGTTVTNPNQINAGWVLNRGYPAYKSLFSTNTSQQQISKSMLSQMKQHNIQLYKNHLIFFPKPDWRGLGDLVIYKGWRKDAGL